MTVVFHLVAVNSLVINHVLLLSKPFPTRITDPGLLSCVNPPVELQLTLADKPPLTELTDPGFDPGWMRLTLVRCDAGLHGETFTTDITHVRPLSAMHPEQDKRQINIKSSQYSTLPQVSYQIGLPAKTCIALITLIRLGVDLLVNSLVTGSGESLRTVFTFQSLRGMFPLNVTVQPLLRTELTGTALTAVFLPRTP